MQDNGPYSYVNTNETIVADQKSIQNDDIRYKEP